MKETLKNRLPQIVPVFCVLQPLLDAAGYWQVSLKMGNTPTLVLRMLMLGGMLLLGFVLSDRKKYYYAVAALLAGFTALHVLACVREGGYAYPIEDLVNLVRIYSLPLVTLCMITFLRQNDDVWPALKKGLVASLAVIVLIMLLSTVTGTDPHTYSKNEIGVLGWFLWTNSQSAILSMLVPTAMIWSLQRWKDRLLPLVLVTAIGEAALYFLAPRLAYACLIVCGLGVGAALLIADRRRRKQALAVFLITVAFVGAFPLSPMRARQNAVAQRTGENQQRIEQSVSSQELSLGSSVRPEDLEDKQIYTAVLNVYNGYVRGIVSRFGLARVAAAYHYSLSAEVLGDGRQAKLTFCSLLMEDSGLLSHAFGLELMDMREFIPFGFFDEEERLWKDGYQNYDVENDLHGIYFLTGFVGLGLMLVFLLYFGVRAAWRVLRSFRERFTPELAGFAIAYACAFAHIVFTASVLRRNNASVYLAMVLAALWYLSRPAQEKQAGG